jgi:hypothetical protein
MANLNTLPVSAATKNVGLTAKSFDPRNIVGAILTPKGYKLSKTIVASTLQAQLLSDAQAASKISRIYPVSNLLGFKDNSEKKVEQSFDYGGKVTVRDGAYTWSFMFVKGGQPLQQALRAFNGSDWDFLFVDSKNQLIGTKYVDNAGLEYIQAITSIEFYAEPFGLNDGKKVAEYNLDFSFFSNLLNDNLEFVADASFDILNAVKGLIDVYLTPVALGTSGHYTLVVKDKMGINLYGQLSALLSGTNKTNLKISNASTGNAITITSSTADATLDNNNGGFQLILDTSDPDYPTSTVKIRFDLIDAASLYSANVIGFESAGSVDIVYN